MAGRRFTGAVRALVGVTVALVLAAATADVGRAGMPGATAAGAYVAPPLLAAATANPAASFETIVQGVHGQSGDMVARYVGGLGAEAKKAYTSINGVAVTLTGRQVLDLARDSRIAAITPDSTVKTTAFDGTQTWRTATGFDALPSSAGAKLPAIAIVDTGIDASHPAFTGRVLESQDFVARGRASADANGHGTMVAGIAAGASSTYPGAAPGAPLVDLRVGDANGYASTSTILSACDWLIKTQRRSGVRVVNFSLSSPVETSILWDPLDKAAEALWLRGFVVVAAAGNTGVGNGAPVSMSHAPGNDPFVITVGALDQNGTAAPQDDFAAPWSAFGHTSDGFAKPEVSAPGRWIVGPVPAAAQLPSRAPERVVAPGYMWMSGTSFSTPMVGAAAAQLLARHPDWSPDQVKGALMSTATRLPAAGLAGGIGEIATAAAAAATPPNPNENLLRFVKTQRNGDAYFDAIAWRGAVSADAGWTQSGWSAASWSEATWSLASWFEASWSEASWFEASWVE